MVKREVNRARLDALAEQACVEEPTIERYSETVYYKNNYYEGEGENRQLIRKKGDIRHQRGDPVLYRWGSREGQPRKKYTLDPEVMGKIWNHVYPYCYKSVVISLGYPDLEMITTLQLEIIRLLEREGPRPLGSPFSQVMPLRVNNVLTREFQEAKRKGRTVIRDVRNSAGEWEEQEAVLTPEIPELRYDAYPKHGRGSPHSKGSNTFRDKWVQYEDPFDEVVQYEDLVLKLRSRVSGEALHMLDEFLAGERRVIPVKFRQILQRELSKLGIDSHMKKEQMVV